MTLAMRAHMLLASLGLLLVFGRLAAAAQEAGDEGCPANGYRPVVFVPGYVLSVLVDSTTGEVAFPSFPQRDLSLPIEWSGDPSNPESLSQARDTLVPFEPLYGVPGFEVDGVTVPPRSFSGSLRALVEGQWMTAFVGFGWDFRRDLAESVPPLAAAVKAAAQASGCRVLLVAHSQGGLLAYGALNTVPGMADHVQSVIYAGVPFAGVPIYRSASTGSPAEPEPNLPDLAQLTFPGASQLLPMRRVGQNVRAGVGYSLDGGNTTAAVDYLELSTWKALKLGPYTPKFSDLGTDTLEAHYRRMLARARAWRIAMDPRTGRRRGIVHPVAAVLAASQHPIPKSAAIAPDGTATLINVVPADETVPYDAVYPPGGACVRRYDASKFFQHLLILENVADVERMARDLFAGGQKTCCTGVDSGAVCCRYKRGTTGPASLYPLVRGETIPECPL